MQFVDLNAQFERIEQEVRNRIDAVLKHGKYIMGPEVNQLEKELASFCGASHALSCASGTDALLLPLMAWGIGPGDAVFVPNFTFFATAEVVSLLGATPIFVDVDPVTFCMDPDKLQDAIAAVETGNASLHPLPQLSTSHRLVPRAVIPVDLFGIAAHYEKIIPVAKSAGLYVLQDAAQSFGCEWDGRRACAMGCDAAATSFFPAKPLGCYGDGGAVFTEDPELAEVMKSLRVHGKGAHKYDNIRIGMNGRLDTIQAAILLAKLEVFEDELERRQQVADLYQSRLAACSNLTLPSVPIGRKSAWAQYSLLSSNRESVLEALKERGIPTAIYYPTPLPFLTAYKSYNYHPDDFPVASRLSEEIFSVPFHPYLSEDSVAFIADTLTSIEI
ncbi:DegT/DnrJ/EryC1/StrS family aminotransferase [Desulfovibrio mangrovi]|uniref:DegT/DnrJ/EryC1/StrS family aminotransferase n=1 Tax=Desulfovibrio mangrovi TaxID=2976983 RepID=UPI0022465942|nr:DegT/DnrJ/EryC1/StrS family aminotransferase [Desulfovibrio mangrovi]UZP66654.1 DegT/DnrJ/EryC1/StrS family aminotransferase [Desulfovibrio mangrovi]